MKSVQIPKIVTSIIRNAFVCCFVLRSIELPDSIEIIKHSEFYLCSFSSIRISMPVTSFCGIPFTFFKKPETIDVSENLNFVSLMTPHEQGNDSDRLLQVLKVRRVCHSRYIYHHLSIRVLNFRELTSITIPRSVTVVNKGSFSHCDG